jgi:phosphohistidine phosphatase SixA
MPRPGDSPLLLVVRHGKSTWPPGVDDVDRPLGPRGERAADAVGRFIAAAGLLPDEVVCSPARRAVETARRLLGSAGTDGSPSGVVVDDRLYEGDAVPVVLDRIAGLFAEPVVGTAALGTAALGTAALGTAALGTAAVGTPASGTPASGTPASGTPASGTPASDRTAPGERRRPRLRCLLVVGHEPELAGLVARVTGADIRLPTAGLAVMELDAARMHRLVADEPLGPCGRLLLLLPPRLLTLGRPGPGSGRLVQLACDR